jgi:hypothetical protein
MSEDTARAEETAQVTVGDESRQNKRAQTSLQDLVDALRSVQEDVGQISEMTTEERALVKEFFRSFLKLMQPFATAVQVSNATVSKFATNVAQANVDPAGNLIIMYEDGQVELKDLTHEKNRDMMISVVEDVVPKFKQLTESHREKIENRIKFLSSVTKEMQKISKALPATADSESSQ